MQFSFRLGVGLSMLVFSSIAINIFGFWLSVLLWPISTKIYRFVIAKAQAAWLDAVAYGIPCADLVLSGDLFPEDAKAKLESTGSVKPLILIANHQVDADWWYLWMIARCYNSHGNVKIILKEALANIPLIGSGMRLFEFIFLARDWNKDKHRLSALTTSFVADDFPCWLLIFPEGTTINSEAMEKSQSFAEKQERPVLKNLLLPRTRGLKYCLDSMAAFKPDIYDMTISYDTYTGEIPTYDMGYSRNTDVNVPNLVSMLSGIGCPTVHCHMKKYTFEEASKNFEPWLDDIWKEKDDLLESFKPHNRFPDSVTGGKQVRHPIKIYITSVVLTAVINISMFIWFFKMPLYFILIHAAAYAFYHFFAKNRWETKRPANEKEE